MHVVLVQINTLVVLFIQDKVSSGIEGSKMRDVKVYYKNRQLSLITMEDMV